MRSCSKYRRHKRLRFRGSHGNGLKKSLGLSIITSSIDQINLTIALQKRQNTKGYRRYDTNATEGPRSTRSTRYCGHNSAVRKDHFTECRQTVRVHFQYGCKQSDVYSRRRKGSRFPRPSLSAAAIPSPGHHRLLRSCLRSRSEAHHDGLAEYHVRIAATRDFANWNRRCQVNR